MIKTRAPYEQHPGDVICPACVFPEVTCLNEASISQLGRELGEILQEAFLDRRHHAIIMKFNGILMEYMGGAITPFRNFQPI